ncbi:MAG TPA: recombinase family protein [Solirubrobacteraceae bacterium]|nr:recombinase family protein [Solirubrobacteraceae bacterium]
MRELGGSAERTAARQAAGQCTGRPSVPLTLVVDGYVGRAGERESTGEAPPSIQRWQIAHWAAARGWRLGRIFEEPVGDRSSDAAPALRQALDRVEARESDGIVITRLNQIGDSLPDVLDSIERIQAAGGVFVSACDGVDISTPTGRLILRLLLSIRGWGLPGSHDPRC